MCSLDLSCTPFRNSYGFFGYGWLRVCLWAPGIRGRRALGQPVAVRTADRVAHPAPWGQLRGAGGVAAGRVRVVRHPILGCIQSVH